MSSYVMICSKLDTIENKILNKLEVNGFESEVQTLSQSVSKQLNIIEDTFGLY